MYDINFLTPEYREKLKRNNLIRRCSLIMGVIFAAQLIVFSGLFIWNRGIENDIQREKQEVALKEGKIAQIQKEMSEIPDLTDKITMIEDLFKNENFRISEVIQSLEDSVPTNLWFNKMNYESGKIRISGVSYQNWELGLTSEENLYQFEKNLIESDLYKKIHHDFTKAGEQNTHKVNNFQFELELRD
jgi:Tfp pilus assembly protein PilN